MKSMSACRDGLCSGLVLFVIATVQLIVAIYIPSFATITGDNTQHFATFELGAFQVCYSVPAVGDFSGKGCADISIDQRCEYEINGARFSLVDCDEFNAFRFLLLISAGALVLSCIFSIVHLLSISYQREVRWLESAIISSGAIATLTTIVSLCLLAVAIKDLPTNQSVREDTSLILQIVAGVFMAVATVRYAIDQCSRDREMSRPLLPR